MRLQKCATVLNNAHTHTPPTGQTLEYLDRQVLNQTQRERERESRGGLCKKKLGELVKNRYNC